MKSRIIVRTFVWADVITFLLQASGSGLTAMDNPSLQDVGHWVGQDGVSVWQVAPLTAAIRSRLSVLLSNSSSSPLSRYSS
jgi:hypothetical protein